MDFSKLKRIVKAPLRYEALRELFVEANRKIVKLQEELNKAKNQLLQKGVDEHFLEEKIEQLEAENSQLNTSAGESIETNIYLVLYDNYDTMSIEYLGQSRSAAEEVLNQNKFHDFYHYRGNTQVEYITHREQGSARDEQ